MERGPSGLERGLLGGVATFRAAALAWMVVLLVAARDDVVRPGVASAAVAGAFVVTAGAFVVLRTRPHALLGAPAVVAELVVGAAVLALHDAVYDEPGSLALGSAWPLAGILAAGIALGPVAGATAGGALGLARWAGHAEDAVLSVVSTGVLFALAGGAVGLVAQRLRRAEREIAAARARDELARTLHDGVLQTLAIVQRRGEPDLARLARDQERELREYLYGTGQVVGAGGDLGQRLRAAAARFEDRFGATARVVLADDVPTLPDPIVDAVAGAVAEALTNAGKHGGAATVTVYAEPDEYGGLLCSVKDDGAGFDPATTAEGAGLTGSVRARIAEVAGVVEIDARPGRGVEVRLRVPGAARP